jgi:carbon-monoxide dehydrogenase large subunit
MTIGTSVKRIEDPRLITGKGQYVGDIKLPDQCEAVIVRSPHAHANILRIDTEKARKLPDVLMVIFLKIFLQFRCVWHPMRL